MRFYSKDPLTCPHTDSKSNCKTPVTFCRLITGALGSENSQPEDYNLTVH